MTSLAFISLKYSRNCDGLMNDIIFLIETDPDGGYVATAVGESIVTQGETLEEVRAMIRDAVHCHFDEGKVPEVIRLQFIREEILAI
ncbi:MAG: type II toxin-antitoxin system HicB family antitoxin [Synechocystis sp.]|jgi:predicted RNase H-like HicB family nuclease